MSESDLHILKEALQNRWSHEPSSKAQPYIGQFFESYRIETKIMAKVVGNHGTYTVSIQADGHQFLSTCSCYIGKHGYCHHCEALARTFLNDSDRFEEIKTKKLEEVGELPELQQYLQGITLETLMTELRANGITQKVFAESIGMNTRHLSAIKSSEQRNRFHNELGATKLACLWILEHFGKTKKETIPDAKHN